MGTRISTKIGDIFQVKLNENEVKFFQLISFDLLQLNSDVIRVFNKTYAIDSLPPMEEILNDKVDFYVHCVTKWGIKMGLWEKIGNSKTVGDLNGIIFRDTADYGGKEETELLAYSNNWFVWKIGDSSFTTVGKIEGENRNSFNGMVINPLGVIELIKGNKYPPLYPDFI